MEKSIVKYKIEMSFVNKTAIICWELVYLASRILYYIPVNTVRTNQHMNFIYSSHASKHLPLPLTILVLRVEMKMEKVEDQT